MIDSSVDFSEERMTELALGAIGKIPLQELINDSVSILIEMYKAKPETYLIDLEEHEEEVELRSNPLSDVAVYLQEINYMLETEDESN